MSRSAFNDWFIAQHGPRTRSGPDVSVVNDTDTELRAAVARGAAADGELRRRELWDEKRTSALYAWQAAQTLRTGPTTADAMLGSDT